MSHKFIPNPVQTPLPMLTMLLAASTVAINPSPVAAQSAVNDPVQQGLDAWEQGDYKTAVAQWQEPARAGNANAQFNLGQAYLMGRGVPPDLSMAQQWLTRAASQGHIPASDSLGLVLFQQGQQNAALSYLRASAKRGDPRAQYILATALFNGDFVEQDWIGAYALMTLSATQGLPQANQALIEMEKFIPIDQRQEGTVLAVKLENEAELERRLALGEKPASDKPADSKQPVLAKTEPQAPSAAGPEPTPQPEAPTQLAQIVRALPEPAAEPAANDPQPAQPVILAAKTTPAVRAPERATPAPSVTGPWRVQLGAFSTETRATALWGNLSKNPALSALKAYFPAAGTLTRLQLGSFASQASAEKICVIIRSPKQPCLPIKN